MILFYKKNIEPTVQYGVLIYCCCSYTSLLLIVKLQRKIFDLKRWFSSVEDKPMMYGILSVYELYVYELFKFVLKSIKNLQSEKYLNNSFDFSNSSRNTRSCCKNLLEYNARKVRIQRYSIHSRCVKLFNTLQHINIFKIDVCCLNREQLSNFSHRVRDSFTLGKDELDRCVFE